MANMETKARPLTFNLGSVEKVPPGQGKCYVVCGEEVAIFRQRDGKIFATQNRCPHLQGPLSEGIIGSGKVVCPLHAQKYDLCTGAGIDHENCIKVYTVRVENGEILLNFEGKPGSTPQPGSPAAN